MPGASPVIVVPEQFSVELAFNADSPLVIGELPEDQDLVEASVLVVEAFNDGAATVRVGTEADSEALMAFDDSELDVADRKFTKSVDLAGPENIVVTLAPVASNQGKVRVILRAVLREEV